MDAKVIHCTNVDFRVLGAVFVPWGGAKHMKMEAAIFPKMKDNYIRAFDRMLKERAARGLKPLEALGDTGQSVFRWWVGDDPNQITFDEYFADMESE